MSNILIYDKDSNMRDSFEHHIKVLARGLTISKTSDINTLLDGITACTRMILLNYSGEKVIDDIILSIKEANYKIKLILTTCFPEEEIHPKFKNDPDIAIHSSCDLTYIKSIKEHFKM